jgi:hypothetical protein
MNSTSPLFDSTLLDVTTTITTNAFIPDFTEHPKPKKIKARKAPPANNEPIAPPPAAAPSEQDDVDDEITFFHDFVAGGVAGSASVIVGHPFDT